jgi:hypothetical protein
MSPASLGHVSDDAVAKILLGAGGKGAKKRERPSWSRLAEWLTRRDPD